MEGTPEYVQELTGAGIELASAEAILSRSLTEGDSACPASTHALQQAGLDPDAATRVLAAYRSSAKYGYEPAYSSLIHIQELARRGPGTALLQHAVRSPVLLMKACWLYEHSPYFVFYGECTDADRDDLVLEFGTKFETDFIQYTAATEAWQPVKDPKRVMATSFWDKEFFDPVQLLGRAMEEGIEGVELCFDFHPFNYTILLPEEVPPLKRKQIREAAAKSGVRISIHSPIIGPYVPNPNPAEGKQRFYDPTKCLPVQYDTIDLARDIGAESVVFHLIDAEDIDSLVSLVERAAGSDVRVTIENYCQIGPKQTSELFISCLNKVAAGLSEELKSRNFGVTLDVGHLNIEGEDPLLGSQRVGQWCLDNDVYLRLHATDNYGLLLFSPPAFSADVHANVSGRGINNALIIKMLRSMGVAPATVVAEQIKPLTPLDVSTIHEAVTCPLEHSFDEYVQIGKHRLASLELGAFIHPDMLWRGAYQFLAGLHDLDSLREYAVYRRIQDKKHLSVDEAKRISQDFLKMPQKLKTDLTTYIDDLLLPLQSETGAIRKTQLDLICQNINGALFWSVSSEHMNKVFTEDRLFGKGETICEQDKPAHEMYFIKEGTADISINESQVASIGQGEIFGEMSLFYNIDRSATVVTTSDAARVGVLTRAGLEALLRSQESYARELVYRLYNTLPGRLRNMNDKYRAAILNLEILFGDDQEEVSQIGEGTATPAWEHAEFLPTLTQEEAARIYPEVRRLSPGDPVFAEGDDPDGAYFIIAGKVKAEVSSRFGTNVQLGELDTGEVFGEMGLIDKKPRSASISCVTASELGFISKQAFDEFIERRSELAFRFMGFICLLLFRRILRLDKAYSDIKARISHSEQLPGANLLPRN